MKTSTTIMRLGAAAVLTAAATGTAAGLVRLMLDLPVEEVDDIVAVGAIGAGVLMLAWYTLTGLLTCLTLTVRVLASSSTVGAGGWQGGEAWLRSYGAPLLRRLAVAGMAASTSLGAIAPAWAGAGTPAAHVVAEAPGADDEDPGGEPPIDLGWPVSDAPPEEEPARQPMDEPTTAASAPPTGTNIAHRPAAPEQASTRHVVEPGESLWSITREHLRGTGEPAGITQIAAAWPRLYDANAELIGPDPDLIRPGQELHVPFKEE